MLKILDKIERPGDLKKLDMAGLQSLALELREFVISTVSRTGGHLAPNLGVVELTLALHYVYDLPEDQIVWDVGHQAYIHKILTGRKDRFHTLRQYCGISGFPKIDESEYDAFGVGHSSTAISAAMGLATARDMRGEDHSVIAVIGDGAMTGGIAFEGLNNAGGSRRNIVVVLNDNRMSISPNVGAMSRYLNQIITAPLYNRIKRDIWNLTGKLPVGSQRLRDTVHRIEEGLKAMVVPGSLFERMGFRYFGPIDGHDIDQLIRVFREIRRLNGPILVHLLTTKGKGYKFAEENATRFHGLGSFCRETGLSEARNRPSYTEVFGKAMVQLAEMDHRVLGITAAMADGTGLIHLQNKFPDRFFDVGIAEQHAVTFAAGLALKGYRPVVAIYSTFLQRAFDQVIHDVALQKIPVVFALDRGGLVGEDGPTHHGAFDLSYLRLIPNLVIMAPKDENELRDMLWTAIQYDEGPVAIRYPRGEATGVPLKRDFDEIPIGKGEILEPGRDMAILAVGDMVSLAGCLSQRLQEKNVSAQIFNARFIKPMDTAAIRKTLRDFPLVITLENNTVMGGFGSGVSELLAEAPGSGGLFKRFGIPDRFVTFGSLSDLHRDVGLDTDTLTEEILSLLYQVRQGGEIKSSIRVDM